MSNDVFRKKSIERINSPEDLNEYIRVSNPGIWLLLTGIIVLLFGAVVWGYVGSIETWEDATIIAENGQVTCVLRPEVQDKLASGMRVVIEDYDIETQILKVISNSFDSVTPLSNQNTSNRNASNEISVTLDRDIADGIYVGKVLMEKIHPKELILN